MNRRGKWVAQLATLCHEDPFGGGLSPTQMDYDDVFRNHLQVLDLETPEGSPRARHTLAVTNPVRTEFCFGEDWGHFPKEELCLDWIHRQW